MKLILGLNGNDPSSRNYILFFIEIQDLKENNFLSIDVKFFFLIRNHNGYSCYKEIYKYFKKKVYLFFYYYYCKYYK